MKTSTPPKTVVAARVDTDLADRIDKLARAEGVTSSRFLENLIRKAVVKMEFHGSSGSAKLRLIAEANIRKGRVLDVEHPGVSIWELDDEDVWPRHFLHVQCESGLTPDEASSDVWLLWCGDQVEEIDPDEYLERHRAKKSPRRTAKKKGTRA